MITEAEFRSLAAQGYNRIPLVLETFADLDTPLSLYLKLAHQRYTYLLESVVGGERFGRYSFIGLPAKIRIRVTGTHTEVEDHSGVIERHDGDPLVFLRTFLARFRAAPEAGLPRFCGGLAGYFGYDTVRYIEPRLATHVPADRGALGDLPDMLLLLTDELAVIDNLAGKIYLIVYADPGEADAWRHAQERLQHLRRKLRTPLDIPYQTATEVSRAESEMGAEAFEKIVRRAKDYIAAGDIMQVVLSQRMQLPFARLFSH